MPVVGQETHDHHGGVVYHQARERVDGDGNRLAPERGEQSRQRLGGKVAEAPPGHDRQDGCRHGAPRGRKQRRAHDLRRSMHERQHASREGRLPEHGRHRHPPHPLEPLEDPVDRGRLDEHQRGGQHQQDADLREARHEIRQGEEQQGRDAGQSEADRDDRPDERPRVLRVHGHVSRADQIEPEGRERGGVENDRDRKLEPPEVGRAEHAR